jgi:predicted O-linked N-acetylglucosamine transferase (SPINDLY family)
MAVTGALDHDLKQALARHQAGDLAAAEQLFRRVLAAAPDHPTALHHLGVIALQQGRAESAVAALDAAAARAPDDARIQFHLALALKGLERPDDAARHYERAIALAPGFADAHVNLGNLRRAAGQLDDARSCYERAIAAAPEHVGASNNLGTVLRELGAPEAAAAAHRRALALNPRHAGALGNLGNALLAQGDRAAAIDCFRRALALAPTLPGAHLNLAGALRREGDVAGAVAALRQGRALQPEDAEILSHLVHGLQELCDWTDLAALQAELTAAVDAGRVAVPFTLLSLPSSAAQQQACARAWMARATAGARPLDTGGGAARGDAPIRLGYLSSDYHEHPTSYLIAELFERHDRGRFAVHAYSTGPDDRGPSRARIVAACDGFVDLERTPHHDGAQRIAADRIDILVDLNGCTAGARPRLLAHRPAPIQVNFLGYPGTMGAAFMDYIIVDPVVAPPADQIRFDEQLVELPHSYQVNDSQRPVAAERPRRADVGLPADAFVFCCFNSAYKLRAEFFDVWMRLLQAVPGSVLWLLDGAPGVSDNLRREAAGRGVDPGCLVFAPSVRFAQHLARQPLADLCLDTLPYGGHTTASDALWSGVPLVTCRGPTFPGRVGASLLTALDLPELITASLADYESLALALARDPARLGALRRKLAAHRTTKPLYDCARFTRDLERAYAAMMARRAAGQAPAPLRIAPATPGA